MRLLLWRGVEGRKNKGDMGTRGASVCAHWPGARGTVCPQWRTFHPCSVNVVWVLIHLPRLRLPSHCVVRKVDGSFLPAFRVTGNTGRPDQRESRHTPVPHVTRGTRARELLPAPPSLLQFGLLTLTMRQALVGEPPHPSTLGSRWGSLLASPGAPFFSRSSPWRAGSLTWKLT